MDAALKHFSETDRTMHALLAAALSHENPPVLSQPFPADTYFQQLARAVVGQQLSTKAANTIWGRFVDLLGNEVVPARILAQKPEALRAVGLSGAKAGYITSIAADILAGKVILDKLGELPDEEVITELTTLKGIGRWSAEMFLMFTLGRPDVFSLGDLGLRNAITINYGVLNERKLDKLITGWAPHRTTAALTLWHSRDNVPV